MTQEEKDLLLKDLCARLPYGVKVQHQRQDYLEEIQTIEQITRKYGEIETESVLGFVDDFKPYLRPMSSMTEEDNLSLSKYVGCSIRAKYGEIYFPNIEDNTLGNWEKVFKWLLKNHFDYQGLIEKGLAIEVTKENNPYETRR